MTLSSMETKAFYGKGRIQFLAHKDEIEAALRSGYPVSVIWRELKAEGKFDAKYEQFVLYVRKHLKVAKRPREPLDLKKTDVLKSDMDPLPSQVLTPHLNEGRSPAIKNGLSSKRAPIEIPKPFNWNPVPLSEEEIATGNITSR